jgi:small subunit ribosomal protein S6
LDINRRRAFLRKYEALLITRPEVDEDGLKSLLDELSALISREGGRVSGVDVWGLRRLEYPIKHEESGQYAVVNFEAETSTIKELERVAGIRDDVLRIKTLVKEGR